MTRTVDGDQTRGRAFIVGKDGRYIGCGNEDKQLKKLERINMKKIGYVDMDNVLVDFPSGIARLSEAVRIKYEGNYDECPGIFSLMDPMPDAIESYHQLAKHFDTYILSTSPWLNSSATMHKVEWVQKHFGAGKDSPAYKRLILSHHKNLNKGHVLIDDRTKNGASEFEGEHILFGSEAFPDWATVRDHLIPSRV